MIRSISLFLLCLMLAACGSQRDMETADSDAGSNAAAAGLGVLVYGLITDDKRAVEKAAGTAAATATVTKVKEGSRASKQEGEWERVIGKENTDGLVALIKRDYRAAKEHLAKAAQAETADQQRVAMWLLAITHYDTGNDEALEPLLAQIVEADAAVANDAEVRKQLGQHAKKLAELRKKYK